MRTLVIIPAYNEATAIGALLERCNGDFDVVVVDDGSRDDTMRIVKQFPVTALSHVVNRGLGGALRTGFAYAIRHGYDAVVTLDADGQHDPQEIPLMVKGLADADVVIGTRRQEDMPRIRRLYNGIGAIITAGLFGGALHDSQSGYRAIRVDSLRRFALKTSRMEISSEILAESFRLGLRIAHVPITVRYTTYSMSKGQGFFEGIRTAWRLFLKALV